MKKAIIILSTIFLMYSCGVVEQLGGAYNLSQCKYDYNSIDNIQVAGINLGKAKSVSVLEIASLSTILAGGTLQNIPFSMVLNLDVTNPNDKAAAFLYIYRGIFHQSNLFSSSFVQKSTAEIYLHEKDIFLNFVDL